jgi:hypothetical protein
VILTGIHLGNLRQNAGRNSIIAKNNAIDSVTIIGRDSERKLLGIKTNRFECHVFDPLLIGDIGAGTVPERVFVKIEQNTSHDNNAEKWKRRASENRSCNTHG